MASPSTETNYTAIEPLLAVSKRVLQNVTSLEDLIAAYPSLKQKCLDSPSTLTDSERRQLLDLPDVSMETVNLSAVTNLSRAQLIEKAVSNSESLTSEEALILKDRFWTPSPSEEMSSIVKGYCQVSMEVLIDFDDSLKTAYVPNEREAFAIGGKELRRRSQAVRDDEMRVKAEAALPDAPGWIQDLYRQSKPAWGFVCFYDGAVQKLGPERLDNFSAHLGAFCQHVLDWNGARSIIDHKWQLMPTLSPATAFAPPQSPAIEDDTDNGSTNEYEDGAVFRNAFRELIRIPGENLESESGITAGISKADRPGKYLATSGVLTNTFLVFDPTCIETVLGSGKWYDNMRVFAFEVDFSVEGRKYEEGYQGYTLVRLDQILYNFYELRSMKADQVRMDQIWKAAQRSPNRAFVSMDEEEALSHTNSCALTGFARDSPLGKRRYPLMEAEMRGRSIDITKL